MNSALPEDQPSKSVHPKPPTESEVSVKPDVKPVGPRVLEFHLKLSVLPKTEKLLFDLDVTANCEPTEKELAMSDIVSHYLKAAFRQIAKSICNEQDCTVFEAFTSEGMKAAAQMHEAAVLKERNAP